MEKTMRERHSVRTFEKAFLSTKDKELIESILAEHKDMQGPFKHTIKTVLIENKQPSKKEGIIGTYGFVKNAPAFIVGIGSREFEHLVDFGYIFEHIILNTVKHHFGTVWLGGTFKRKQFDIIEDDQSFIPAITPVGYPAEKPSIREQAIRKFAGSDGRKPFEDLFFNQNFSAPLKRSKIPTLSKILDFVRYAPSASNKQPWRVLLEGKNIHLYLKESPKYIGNYKYNIQAIDAGIAIAHLELGLNDKNIAFTTKIMENTPTEDGLRYIISFKLKKSLQ